jgi:hypothetical protein
VKITKGSFVGVGISTFKSGYGNSFLPRINTGVFAKLAAFEELSLRPELAYSQRGDILIKTGSIKEAVMIEYIDFSLLADYRVVIHESSGFSVHGMVGPMWSRMFQSSHHQEGTGFTSTLKNIYSQTSKTDFGFLLGSGFGVNIGNGSMFVDVRYFLGTRELTVPPFSEPMLNRMVSFVTGFEF